MQEQERDAGDNGLLHVTRQASPTAKTPNLMFMLWLMQCPINCWLHSQASSINCSTYLDAQSPEMLIECNCDVQRRNTFLESLPTA